MIGMKSLTVVLLFLTLLRKIYDARSTVRKRDEVRTFDKQVSKIKNFDVQ